MRYLNFLPIINLEPNNVSCIYTTLCYISDLANKYGKTAIITFDQPLWMKALSIIETSPTNSPLKRIVLKLGGFHILMSFLGAIGTIMAGSGLKDVMELVYAKSLVVHMLSGKAYSRAVRGHLLIVASLYEILYSKFLFPQTSSNTSDLDPSSKDNCLWKDDLEEAKHLLNCILSGEAAVIDVLASGSLERMKEEISKKEKLLEGPMCKLWFQYIQMVNIMRRFLQGERTGNWKLHLQALDDMLPYLAAAGHNNYTKSIHLYLQKMSLLPHEDPETYDSFINGMHVIRRSKRYWSGLSSDLVIEQVLMRSLKTTGGVTRGRGMQEDQQLVWILSRPICAEINEALQQLTNTLYEASDQHKDLTKSRMKKDSEDIKAISNYLRSKNLFDESQTLYNIETGTYSAQGVNDEDAKNVGEKILMDMKEKSVEKYVFRKKNQVVNMESTLKISGNDSIAVDPLLLFQRLLVVSGDNEENLFSYELCSYPPALFHSTNCMLSADKSSLASFIWKQFPDLNLPLTDHTNVIQYVVDGGALLHRIPWENGNTFGEISLKYVCYLRRHYKNPMVIFDSYEQSNTKDMTHKKRTSNISACPSILIRQETKCKVSKEKFLANTSNKLNFIKLLKADLQKNGILQKQAEGDADYLIAKTAVSLSKSDGPIVLVADDTDILILLLAHVDDTCKDVYLRPEPKIGQKSNSKCWDIKKFQEKLGKTVCEKIYLHTLC